jgi:hypothetical protein
MSVVPFSRSFSVDNKSVALCQILELYVFSNVDIHESKSTFRHQVRLNTKIYTLKEVATSITSDIVSWPCAEV